MSRENILKNINKNLPAFQNLPEIDFEIFTNGLNLKEEFIKNFEFAGGKVVQVESKDEIGSYIKSLFKDAVNIFSLSEDVKIGTIDPSGISSVKEIENLDLAIVEGDFGVAENGAVWVGDKILSHRSIPFITSHLVLLLNENEIVENLHEAYKWLASFDEGYGVFISGPSKTADIEQSLVIGAQGALSTTIFIIN